VLFFGNIAMRSRRGAISPSTIVRCLNIAKELKKYDFNAQVMYASLSDLRTNISAIKRSDIVIFHRIQNPFLNMPMAPTEPVLVGECKALDVPIVFDIDDSIFLQYPILTELLMAEADLVTAGSHFLCEFARRWNDSVCIVPSAVDTELFRPLPRRKSDSRITLGWHGSAAVQFGYLKYLRKPLERLARKYDITFKLLGTLGSKKIQSYFTSVPGLRTDFGPNTWVPYHELPYLLADVDIGLSPLPMSVWTVGKCAMKALEYMAMEIPVVASAVGEHNYIIHDGRTGLIAHSSTEWVEKIEMLVRDSSLRRSLGHRGRQVVEESFSLEAVGERVKNILLRFLRHV